MWAENGLQQVFGSVWAGVSDLENVPGFFHEHPGQEDILIFNAPLLKVRSLRIVSPTPQR